MNIHGFKCINVCRSRSNKRAKRGSGGLTCYIREEINEGIEHVNCAKTSEDRLWIKLQADFFGLDKDVFLCLAYVSPDTSCHPASRDSLWSLLEEEIAAFSTTGHIILTGDFNARTGSLPDYVTYDSDSHIPLPPDYTADEPIPRMSEDKRVNSHGRELLELCVASQLRILNGRITPDKDRGVCTCFTPRGSSVVDYAAASVDLLGDFKHFQVEDISQYSDHCPLSFN